MIIKLFLGRQKTFTFHAVDDDDDDDGNDGSLETHFHQGWLAGAAWAESWVRPS